MILPLEQQQVIRKSNVAQLLRHSIKAQHEEKRRVMTDILVQEKHCPVYQGWNTQRVVGMYI